MVAAESAPGMRGGVGGGGALSCRKRLASVTKGLSAYCAPGVMPRAVLEGGMAPGVLATPREVEDAIGPGLCRGRRGLVHAAGHLKCPWRASRLGLSPKSAGLQTPALVPWRGRTQPHCSTLGGAGGALGLPGACVFSSGIYGALTVCLTVLDVGEGANDTTFQPLMVSLGESERAGDKAEPLESPAGPRIRASRKASEVPGPPGCLNPRL